MEKLTSRSNRLVPRWGRRVLGALGCAALVLGVSERRAKGAGVAVSGPSDCADANTITEQVDDVLGRPLSAVPAIDFEISLLRRGSGWHLRLDAIEADKEGGPPVRRSRELQAATCAELVDAAAVGIAMSVRAMAEAERPATAPEPAASPPRPPPSPPPPLPDVPRGTGNGRSALGGRLATVADIGALPAATIGIEIGGMLRLRWVRLGVSGTVLAPREAQTASGAGGEVGLIYGAIEICAPASDRRVRLFGCGGFELGRLSGEGTGVMRPRLGAALWQMVRAELGVGFSLGPRLLLAIRAGAGLPLSRPQFVINGSTPVHQPAAVVARAGAGVELEF
jgi:hypothetical protein